MSEVVIDSSIDSFEYDMSEGKVYEFTFAAPAGLVFSASAQAESGSELDPLLVLLDEDGKAIFSDDDSGVNLDAVISDYVISEAGQYTLLLSHAGGGYDGRVNVTIDIGGEIVTQFEVYNLFVSEKAEVYSTGGDRLNLRSGPGLDFEIVDKLEMGELVTLLEGPHKSDGYAWWRVRNDEGVIGWAVERVEGEQTLQLALLVGEEAFVTSGDELLNVRSGAGTDFDVVARVPDGERVDLLEMPQISGGYRWWHIQLPDGTDGWVVDRVDGERMLIPTREREKASISDG